MVRGFESSRVLDWTRALLSIGSGAAYDLVSMLIIFLTAEMELWVAPIDFFVFGLIVMGGA